MEYRTSLKVHVLQLHADSLYEFHKNNVKARHKIISNMGFHLYKAQNYVGRSWDSVYLWRMGADTACKKGYEGFLGFCFWWCSTFWSGAGSMGGSTYENGARYASWFICSSPCILYINKMITNKTCRDLFNNPHSSNITSSLNFPCGPGIELITYSSEFPWYIAHSWTLVYKFVIICIPCCQG